MDSERFAKLKRLHLTFLAAVALPLLLAFNVSPSATTLNQLAALCGWGLVLLSLGAATTTGSTLAPWSLWSTSPSNGWPVLFALAIYACGLGASWWQGLPPSLALSALGILGATAFTFAASSCLRPSHALSVTRTFLGAWVLVGVISSLIALIQVFAPAWAEGNWIARTGLVGRAVGNVRQPNHLAILLLWSMAASVPWVQSQRWMKEARCGFPLLVLLMSLFVC